MNKSKLSALSWSGAVAIVIVEDSIAFIKRSDEMPSHKGQIGFFGGHKQNDELEPSSTAIRELCEESGLGEDNFEVLGLMPTVATQGGKRIIPCLVRSKLNKNDFMQSIVSNGEWSNCLLAPIGDFQIKKLWNTAVIFGESKYPVYFFPLLRSRCKYLNDSGEDYSLWGASAKMVWNIFKNELISVKND